MKFNVISTGKNITANHEGKQAYKLSPEWQLYTVTVTSLLSDKFYECAETRIESLRSLIGKCDPLFVARLAVYTRRQMNMRSIPLVLAVELAKIHRGDNIVRKMVNQIIQRADEITELLAYYQIANERREIKKLNRLSKQLQTGLQDAFNRFDEYQFAKYNRDTEIKLRDALFLVHPKAVNEEQHALFNKIVNNELETPYTWETELSQLGRTGFDSAEARNVAFRSKWEELIDSGKVGYMALLRNLRNILEAEVSNKHIEKICNMLASGDAVRRSKQLPFRFLAAYREVIKTCNTLSFKNIAQTSRQLWSHFPASYREAFRSQPINTTLILDALETAVTISAENIKGFEADTNVLIACDVSGSMQTPVSPRSKILAYDIGLILAMLLKSRCGNAITGMFGSTWKVINVPTKGILANVDTFYRREGEVGYSTNGYLVIESLLKQNVKMDKIMFFTDMQLWNSRGETTLSEVWKQYKKISPDSKLYLFDLSGYGTTPLDIAGNDVYLIAGWSDKVFDILDAIENGSNALNEINAIEL